MAASRIERTAETQGIGKYEILERLAWEIEYWKITRYLRGMNLANSSPRIAQKPVIECTILSPVGVMRGQGMKEAEIKNEG